MKERERGFERCCIPGCTNQVEVIMARGMGEGLGGAWRHTTALGGYIELRVQDVQIELDYNDRPKNMGEYIHRGHVCQACTEKMVGNIDVVWALREKANKETFIATQQGRIDAMQKDLNVAKRELDSIMKRLREEA